MKEFLVSKKNEAAWFGVFAVLVALCINSYKHGADYHVFYVSGMRARLGESLYQLQDIWFVFKYHPIFALAFSPLTFIPEKLGLTLMNIAMAGCWFWSLMTWARWLGYKMTPPKILLMALLSLSCLAAEFGFGQVNGALFAGLTLIFLFIEEKNRPILAGMLMACVVAVKINYGLIFFYGLTRNWRSLIGAAIGTLLIHSTVVVYFHQDFFNPVMYHEWLALLLQQSNYQFTWFENQGFLRFYNVLFSESGAHIAWAVTVLLFLIGGFLFRKKQHPAVAAYWVGGLFLLSPLAWWYQTVYLFPAAFWLLKQKLPNWERWIAYIAIAVFALVTFNTLGKQGVNAAKEALIFFYTSIILAGVFVHQLRNRPQQLV